MSTAEDLNDYIGEQNAPFDDANGNEPAQHWVVDDEGRAEWALRKLAKIRRQQARNVAVADEEKAHIGSWLERQNGTLDGEAQFFEGLLTTWHRALLHDDPERKTISLPAGVLRARQLPDVWTFGDDFTRWAESHARELLRVKTEVDRSAAKKRLTAVSAESVVDRTSGEQVPGVTVEAGDVKFTVTVDGIEP